MQISAESQSLGINYEPKRQLRSISLEKYQANDNHLEVSTLKKSEELEKIFSTKKSQFQIAFIELQKKKSIHFNIHRSIDTVKQKIQQNKNAEMSALLIQKIKDQTELVNRQIFNGEKSISSHMRLLDQQRIKQKQTETKFQQIFNRKELLRMRLSSRRDEYHKLVASDQNDQKSLEEGEEEIKQLKQEIAQLRVQCEERLAIKNALEKKLLKFKKSKIQLTQTLKSENSKKMEAKQKNDNLEKKIQTARDLYEKIQSQNFLLDQKNDNLRKFGCEQVPLQLNELRFQKDRVKDRISQIRQQFELQKQSLQDLIPANVIHNLEKRIDSAANRKKKLIVMRSQNQNFEKQNAQMNSIRNNLEWSPNQRIKQLSELEEKYEEQIGQMDQQVNLLKKKLIKLTQKRQELHKKQVISKDKQVQVKLQEKICKPQADSIQKSQVYTKKNFHGKKKKEAKGEKAEKQSKSLYKQIKTDMEKEQLTKKLIPYCNGKPQCKSKNHKIQNKDGQTSEGIIKISSTSFKINKKRNNFLLLFISILLLVLSLVAHKIYKK